MDMWAAGCGRDATSVHSVAAERAERRQWEPEKSIAAV